MKTEVPKQSEKIVYAGMLDIKANMITDVPVDTGRLKSSIQLVKKSDGWTIEANAPYAAYVEFGTGFGVRAYPDFSLIRGLRQYALTFKGAGIREVNRDPQPYFFRNWFEGKQKILADLQKMIRRVRK